MPSISMDSRLGFLNVGDHRHGIQHQVHLRRTAERQTVRSTTLPSDSAPDVDFAELWKSIHSVATDTLQGKLSSAQFRAEVMKNARLTKCNQCIKHTSQFLRKFSDAEIASDAERIAYILHVYANCQAKSSYQPPPFVRVETKPTSTPTRGCNCRSQ